MNDVDCSILLLLSIVLATSHLLLFTKILTQFSFHLSTQLVPKAEKSSTRTRLYDKTKLCYFCGQETPKIPRHLRTCHKEDQEVFRIEAIADGRLKNRELDHIRHKGNLYHNLKALKCGVVCKVIRCQNPSEKTSFRQFVPSTHCLGFVQKQELWRHTAKCPFNEGEALGNLSGKHSKLQFEREMLLYGSKDGQSNAFIQSITSVMRQDEVSFVAKWDYWYLHLDKPILKRMEPPKQITVHRKCDFSQDY